MTELSPDRIIAKLEKDGKAVVADKLKAGVYADYKLPLIRKWLKDQVAEAAEEKIEAVDENVEVVLGGGAGTVSEIVEEDPIIELVDEVVFDDGGADQKGV